jgi:thioesterase domain-containing protein
VAPAQEQPGSGANFNNQKIEAAFRRAVEVYEVETWDGPITLFRPPVDRCWKVSAGRWVSAEREYVFEDNDWRQYAPRIEVIEVPGNHVDMVLAPNVTVLAQELAEVIDRASRPRADGRWSVSEAAE